MTRPQINLRRFLFYFITLAALILIYFRFSELELIDNALRRSDGLWLTVIIAVQFLTYIFITLNYRDVLRVKDLEVGFKKLLPTAFVIQFLNQALPSAGFSGQAFFVQHLRKYGLSIAEGIGRAILELATLYMAFGSFFIISSAMLYNSRVFSNHPELRFFIYVFTFFALIAVGLFLLLQKRGRGRIARWLIGKFHRYFENKKTKHEESGVTAAGHMAMIVDQFKGTFSLRALKAHARPFWRAYLWQNLVLLLDVLTLYFVAFAIGHKISFNVAFVAFTFTQMISMLSFIPGALGVYEGGMTLILVWFGVPGQIAFASTLLLRAFTFWLPMPIGWILYRWYSHKQDLANPYENGNGNGSQP